MQLKIGIFFGGPSRQREKSFANARSLFTNLDRQLFEPVLIFADSQKHLYLVDWVLLFRESLCGSFPEQEIASTAEYPYPVYEESLRPVKADGPNAMFGPKVPIIAREELPQLINFAVTALCGYPEETEWLRSTLKKASIPYAGSGPTATRYFGSFSATQKFLAENGFPVPKYLSITAAQWEPIYAGQYEQAAEKALGLPIRIFPATDPSNYSVIDQDTDPSGFRVAMDGGFFQERIPLLRWQEMHLFDRADYLRQLTDLRTGLGFPVMVQTEELQTTVNHPAELLRLLNELAANKTVAEEECLLISALPACPVVLQSQPDGKPFDIIVLPSVQGPVAFPPTGYTETRIRAADFNANRSSWTGQRFSNEESESITRAALLVAEKAATKQILSISGKITSEGQVYLEQLSADLSFLPGEALFIAAGQAGLLPSEWLTQLICFHLQSRIEEEPTEVTWRGLMNFLQETIAGRQQAKPVGIIYTEKGVLQGLPASTAQIVQFLGAEGSFRPIPLQLQESEGKLYLKEGPVVALLAFNHREGSSKNLPIQGTSTTAPLLPPGFFSTPQLAGKLEAVFIDTRSVPAQGLLQKELKSNGISFNGPGSAAAKAAIHPFQKMEALRRNTSLSICGQYLLTREAFAANPEACMQRIESKFPYPLLGIPSHQNAIPLYRREELEALIKLIFRPSGTTGEAFRNLLRIKIQQEIPPSDELLFQEIIRPRGARELYLLSVPLVSKFDAEGNPTFQVCSPEARQSPRYLSTYWQQESRSFSQLSPEIQQKIAVLAKSVAETAARVLNVQGAAIVELTIRAYDNQEFEPIIEQIELSPEWHLNGPLVRGLIRDGQFPGDTLSDILRDILAKPHLEQMALDAQINFIASRTPFPGPVPSNPHPIPEQEVKNSENTMENSAPSLGDRINEIRRKIPATGITGIFQEALLGFWHFISSAIFLKNLAAALLFIFLFVNAISGLLKLYTNHGQSVEVQDYQGMTAREAKRKARSRSFTTLVNDSVYIVGKAPNIVLDQIPKPGAQIKKNRYIYLTVSSSTPPQVPLPTLIGGNDDFDQYQKKLERLGIKARIKDREFNAELENNTILYLVFNGERIEPSRLKRGFKVPKGSVIDIVVSIRNTGTVDIPDLVCKTYEEAVFLLQSSQLTVGSVFSAGEPLPWLYVYKQDPGFNPTLKLSVGEGISLYLSEEKPENCPE